MNRISQVVSSASDVANGVLFLCLLVALMMPAPATADIVVTDFFGRTVHLEQPADRIVALAPNIVENLYTVGVGDKLVGAVEYSDYPQAAKDLPRVGSYAHINMEMLITLAPDLVIAWAADPSEADALLRRMQILDIPVYIAKPRELEDIAHAIEDYGRLGGRPEYASKVAARFRSELASLRARYADREPVSVFYQVWHGPLITLSGKAFVGSVIRLCGGRNIFSDLDAVAPKVSREAVLIRDPEAIVASGTGTGRPKWLDEWKAWPNLQAVEQNHLYFVPPGIIQRPTVRILKGARRLCRKLQIARSDD